MKMKTICRTDWLLLPITLIAVGCASVATAAEHQLVAPGGGVKVIVSDAGGLNYRVEVDGKTVLTNSPLGLEFQDGARLGPSAVITNITKNKHSGNHVTTEVDPCHRDDWRELRLTLEERGTPVRTFGLIVRAYDDGVAFRYDFPNSILRTATDNLSAGRQRTTWPLRLHILATAKNHPVGTPFHCPANGQWRG